MAHNRIRWQDHVVEHERTYRMVQNQDGTITLYPEPGEIEQQGTPLSATNLNRIEEGVQDNSATLDMIITLHQAQIREKDARIALLENQIAILGGEI